MPSELKLKVAYRAMHTSLEGLSGVYQIQRGARMYVVASPLLKLLGLPVVNVRAELMNHGIDNTRLVPVALPGNLTPPPMHVIPLGKARQLIRKMRKVDKQIAGIKAIRDSQPELPFGEPPKGVSFDNVLRQEILAPEPTPPPVVPKSNVVQQSAYEHAVAELETVLAPFIGRRMTPELYQEIAKALDASVDSIMLLEQVEEAGGARRRHAVGHIKARQRPDPVTACG